MTTTFELASTIDTYLAFGVSQVADPYSVYNSLSRIQPVSTAFSTDIAPPPLDSADISGASVLVAAALTGSDVRTDRIASVRQSIADGTYRVSSAAVAGSLLKSIAA